MKLMKEVTRYNERNGQPYQTMVMDKELSDFSGNEINDGYSESLPYGWLSIDYDCQDACFGAGEEEYELRQMGIDMYEFMNDAYAICWEEQEDCNQDFIAFVGEHPDCSYGDYLRYIRVRTALTLLAEGKIEVTQLNGYEGDY